MRAGRLQARPRFARRRASQQGGGISRSSGYAAGLHSRQVRLSALVMRPRRPPGYSVRQYRLNPVHRHRGPLPGRAPPRPASRHRPQPAASAASSATPAAHGAWVNMACPFRRGWSSGCRVYASTHGPPVQRGSLLPLQVCCWFAGRWLNGSSYGARGAAGLRYRPAGWDGGVVSAGALLRVRSRSGSRWRPATRRR